MNKDDPILGCGCIHWGPTDCDKDIDPKGDEVDRFIEQYILSDIQAVTHPDCETVVPEGWGRFIPEGEPATPDFLLYHQLHEEEYQFQDPELFPPFE